MQWSITPSEPPQTRTFVKKIQFESIPTGMGPQNQYSSQTVIHTSSTKQQEITEGAAGGASHGSSNNNATRKNKGKSSGTTSESSSSSSYDYKRYPNPRAAGAIATGGINSYHEDQQYHRSSGGAHGGTYQAEGDYQNAGHEQRRHGVVRRQAIRLPDQPSCVRQVRHRLPTPEPDTLERVYIRRQPAEIVEEIIEEPTTPPPRVQESTVFEPAGPPQVVRKVVRVPPRQQGYQQQSVSGTTQQQAAGYEQSSQSYGNAGGYYQSSSATQVQQPPPQGYQQYNYGAQQAAPAAQLGYNPMNAGGPPPGIPPNAFCFEVGGAGGAPQFPPQGAFPNQGLYSQNFGGAPAGGIGGFPGSGFGGGFGGGQMGSIASYGAGASFGGAPMGGQGLAGYGGSMNPFAGNFSFNAMSGFAGMSSCGGCAGGLGGYGSSGGFGQMAPSFGGFGGGGFGGGASFGGGMPCGGGWGSIIRRWDALWRRAILRRWSIVWRRNALRWGRIIRRRNALWWGSIVRWYESICMGDHRSVVCHVCHHQCRACHHRCHVLHHPLFSRCHARYLYQYLSLVQCSSLYQFHNLNPIPYACVNMYLYRELFFLRIERSDSTMSRSFFCSEF